MGRRKYDLATAPPKEEAARMVGACIYWELHIENHFMLGYASKEQYVLARAWRRDAMRIFDALYQEVL